MKSKWRWWLGRLVRRIWFRATLFSIAGVLTALLAVALSPYIPEELPTKIGADAVDKILGIIASSMLTVTTFSLSTMVSAYSAATTNVTPRATTLVMEDSTTQNVLATFVGSFLFSLVGIIALTTGAYGDRGRVILFVVTLGVIVLIIVTLLRWIDHLSRLGRVTETTERVERATVEALRVWIEMPHLGGNRLSEHDTRTREPNLPICQESVGYVQHVDAGVLSAIAEEFDVEIAVVAIAGKLVAPKTPLAWVTGKLPEDAREKLAAAFTVGDVRSFDQDPRFGAAVLSEIASRALSPAVNDPGTAIDVISRAARVLAVLDGKSETKDVEYPKLFVAPVTVEDLFDDLFLPIARDGAALVEVSLRLQKTFAILAQFNNPEFRNASLEHSAVALKRCEASAMIQDDITKVHKVADLIQQAN
ncbi:DUF2254 domain-containing protein [Agrobacterium larrymoorei]|uniref:DUF2254 domain-containing protein n=1 Tax=Agrobacterium larrymoorei TaxID=160699 RepID=A0A4D7DTF0_9HYPH|nr:DUF2254 domain-containing protein [Agrobacterium larrymoorei]QCJ00584.1 DUF2254 domain-containing protein [Agrobacterium larrymoorei]QYA10582.1 DUF2254 domain-containing protein [Agrobacterium larrymoorei]